MTTTETVSQPVTAAVAERRVGRPRLIAAELLKLRTTNSWWIFGIIVLAFTGLALLLNIFVADQELNNAELARQQPLPDFKDPNMPQEEQQRLREEYLKSIDVDRILVRSAANIFTSGQYFGLLFIAVLGVLIITNEYFHQTATATFLAMPRRTRVIVAKLIAAATLAALFWAVVTAVDIAVGSAYFLAAGYSVPLAEGAVIDAMLKNLLAFVIWAMLGVALGVLIRSQLGATLTASGFYLVTSFPVALLFFTLVRTYLIKEDWVWNAAAFAPGIASQIMVSTEPMVVGYGQNGEPIYGPAWWIAALALVAYGVVAAVVGTSIIRKRDIS